MVASVASYCEITYSLIPAYVLVVEIHQQIPEIKLLLIHRKIILARMPRGNFLFQLPFLYSTHTYRECHLLLGSFVDTVGRSREQNQ